MAVITTAIRIGARRAFPATPRLSPTPQTTSAENNTARKLRIHTPPTEDSCAIAKLCDHVYPNKFHGKPIPGTFVRPNSCATHKNGAPKHASAKLCLATRANAQPNIIGNTEAMATIAPSATQETNG